MRVLGCVPLLLLSLLACTGTYSAVDVVRMRVVVRSGIHKFLNFIVPLQYKEYKVIWNLSIEARS